MKKIYDISGRLPTILCELDDNDGSLTKAYFYADSQILKQVQYDNLFVGGSYDEYWERGRPSDPNWYWYKWLDSDPDANTTPYYYVHKQIVILNLLIKGI